MPADDSSFILIRRWPVRVNPVARRRQLVTAQYRTLLDQEPGLTRQGASGREGFQGAVLNPQGFGTALRSDNLTLECSETFTVPSIGPYHAWKRGKVANSTIGPFKIGGISKLR